MDPVLSYTVDLTLEDKKRPLYPNALKEPSLYRRYIKPWILEGIESLGKYQEMQKKLVSRKQD